MGQIKENVYCNGEDDKKKLLINMVVTLLCNYRCPYCFIPSWMRRIKRDMFTKIKKKKWLNTLSNLKFDLEFNFTGGEPLLKNEFIDFLSELCELENVHYIRVDTNASANVKKLIYKTNKKVRCMATFHPSQVSFDRFINSALLLHQSSNLSMVNYVAYPFDREKILTFIYEFTKKGIFVNIAKNIRYKYPKEQIEFIDSFQTPEDNYYKNKGRVKGNRCLSGFSYIRVNHSGKAKSCRGRHGNIFKNLKLADEPIQCPKTSCPCIIDYSQNLKNNFSGSFHLDDYVKRNIVYRKVMELW